MKYPDHADCPLCFGTGVQSTYWGEIVHPMYGRMEVNGEHRWPLEDVPGGQFFGGSAHQRCSRLPRPEAVT